MSFWQNPLKLFLAKYLKYGSSQKLVLAKIKKKKHFENLLPKISSREN